MSYISHEIEESWTDEHRGGAATANALQGLHVKLRYGRGQMRLINKRGETLGLKCNVDWMEGLLLTKEGSLMLSHIG